MLFRKNHIKKLTAQLGMSEAELLAKVQEAHPKMKFNEIFVVADEETRYVAIATYKVDYQYRGHPPSLAFAIYKDDSRVEEIPHAGYGLGIK
jgi:hypothetical protein